MKKLISISLLMIIIINFIFSNCVYSSEEILTKSVEVYTQNEAPISDEGQIDLILNGTASRTQGSGTKTILGFGALGGSLLGAITGLIARVINVLLFQVDLVVSYMTYSIEESDGYINRFFTFTIERAVFNRVSLFNINFFNSYINERKGFLDFFKHTMGNYKVGNIEIRGNESNAEVKESVAEIYYLCRFIALALGLLVLIYIGIRMALSSAASEKAKYKKMLYSWVESIIVMFLLLYIMSFAINISEGLTSVLYNLEQNLLKNDIATKRGIDTSQVSISDIINNSFEKLIRTRSRGYIIYYSGLELTFWSIIYWCLIFTELKFFWTYSKRLLMVGLLIAISPLITITYSIDKAGDGKAQAFSIWMQEFLMNVFIQPIHASIYLVFILTANSIAIASPLVAVAFLMSMGTVENVIKKIFNLKDLESLKSIKEINLLKRR